MIKNENDSAISTRSDYFIYLRPLVKWRILDISSLRQEGTSYPKKNNFYRILRYLEQQQFIKSYRDPHTFKKYIYLDSKGEKEILFGDNPPSISRSTLMHDLKVSEIARAVLHENLIEDVLLEHELVDRKTFYQKIDVLPDAAFLVKRGQNNVKIAFELELTRKTISRILQKANQYAISDYYQKIIYFFSNPHLEENYQRIISQEISKENFKKFYFFSDQDLIGGKLNAHKLQGFHLGQKTNFLDVFK